MESDIRELIRSKMLMYHIVPLGQGLAGFVYRSRKGRYHIFISSSLNEEAQRQVFFHEAWHVIVDMPRMPFVIGIDMQRNRVEVDADSFAQIMC